MIALGDVALLRPWWLLALPLLALLFVLTKPKSGALTSWQRAVDSPLLAAMVARGGTSGAGRVWTPIVLAVIVGILALSGPAIRSVDQDHLRNLDATLIVMDLSQDVAGGAQLRTAASAAHDVLDHSSARQAGLILYAGDAYLASALTDDTNGIDPLLFALDDKTVPDPGTRPDRALSLARKVLREAHIIQGDVVLITGGGGLDSEATRKEATALRTAGHRVDVLSLTSSGEGDSRRSAAIAAVASAGGGLAEAALTPERVLAALSDQSIQHLGSSAIIAIGWRDIGRFLLIAAAFPLLLGFRRVAA
ncbi:VWA domain-containing protein [Beijerinckia sp. L45]|uniref:VWA domain-containing protein n=1 Tax=Beijerinckia sp. L45 TaxID=1641855 RepID=UPI00131E5AE0|nr:VWA domain-containing protein [Beijerinckia sp. L45]